MSLYFSTARIKGSFCLENLMAPTIAEVNYGQGGSNFETIFSTRVFATIFSLFEMFVLTISSPYQKKESYVKV